MFEIIITLVFGTYFFFLIAFTIGLKKRFPKDIKFTPSVSVIVCARNEERNILSCLESLSKIKYPTEKLEVIIVDDGSSDSTGEIIDNFIKDKNNFIKVNPLSSETIKGKINALHNGIISSKGEIILFTDADCTVEPLWVRNTVSYYKDKTGMVCGFTSLDGKTVFEKIQDIDLTYLISVASGTANIRKPVSCIGNNISFRRSAYNETGGFEKFPFSVTEDFLLMNEIARLKKYEILFPLDNESLVHSGACPDLKSAMAQKKRWGAGGLKGSPYALTIMSIAFLSNLSVLMVPLFFSSVSLYLAIFKISADYFFLYPVCQKLGKKSNLRYFLLYEVYFTIYIVVLPVLLLINKKISWKGREF